MRGIQTSLGSGDLVVRVTAPYPDNERSSEGFDGHLASQTVVGQESQVRKTVELSIYDGVLDSKGRLGSKNDLTPLEQTKRKNSPRDDDLHAPCARMAWHEIVVPIEVKTNNGPLPFTFNDDNTGGKIIKGRMTEYLAKILICQHRTHLFSLYIRGPVVYLMRWDRAGAVMCNPFSLEDEPHKLHRFLHRLTKMSRSQRGYDETVKPATPEQIKMFKAFTPNNPYHEECKSEALRWPLYTVTLPGFGVNASAEVHLILGKPRSSSQRLIGRSTRGYVAFDLDSKRLVFLKDYWRPGREGVRTELDVYGKLKKHEVPYIATPIGGGDVISDMEPQSTITHLFVKGVGRLRHYRFAVQQVGRPIEDYETPRDMVMVLSQALSGMFPQARLISFHFYSLLVST